jgi:uncharacterized protein YggL (DUF469 family)
MMPGTGEFASLVGRLTADEIIQEGATMDGSSLQRWTFSEIAGGSFRWCGEASTDGGATWVLEQRMACVKMTETSLPGR